MANSTIPNLNAVTVPALTDLFGVRQSGDTRDTKLTAAQLLSLGGDVSKVGTPVNDQIGVWTGDGTIEGNAHFNQVGNAFRSTLGNGPSILNVSSTSGTVPSLVPRQGDPNTGVSNAGDDRIALTAGGVMALRAIELSSAISVIDLFGPTVVTGRIRVSTGTGPAMQDEAVSGTNPTLTPNLSDDDSGIGQNAVDQVSIIAGGVQIAQAKEASGANQFIIAPGVVQNAPTTPSLAFGDGNTGFYESADNTLVIATGNGARWQFQANNFLAINAAGPFMFNAAPSSTFPTIGPGRNDVNTGIGREAADHMNLIAGGLSCMSVRNTAAARQIGFYVTAPISLQTGVGVDAASIHAALVALGLITA